MKSVDRWHSERLGEKITVARWGVRGTPVLVFPTAGGDAEEIERHHLVGACGDLLAAGRVKLYSVDSVAGRALFAGEGTPQHQMWLLNQFHECMRHEVVPAMRADSAGFAGPLLATGSSIGAFNALAMLCRYPDQFGAAICLSGSYSLERFYGAQATPDLYVASPQLFLPGLTGPQLDQLRQRFVVLASGEGRWEDIGETWAMAHLLGAKGIPNRVDPWGPEWDHLWPTWWRMLPQYLAELT